MSLALPGALMVFFSVIAFWKESALMFMLAGGASITLGFYWFDVYTSNIGLSASLLLFAYSLVCFGFAFRYIFWRVYNRIFDRDEE